VDALLKIKREKTMKKLFILSVALALMLGCATVPKCPPCPSCPSENAIFPIGPNIPVMVPGGFFDDHDNWMTEKQFRDAIEKQGGF